MEFRDSKGKIVYSNSHTKPFTALFEAADSLSVSEFKRISLLKTFGTSITSKKEYLISCDFDGLNLKNVSFQHCVFRHCYFSNSTLDNCQFYDCVFIDCNFTNVKKLETCIYSTFTTFDLNTLFTISGSIINTSKFLQRQIEKQSFLPETGSFIGWKKLHGGKYAKLEILPNAKRSHSTSRKCRCSAAKVLGIYNESGKKLKKGTIGYSWWTHSFTYTEGQIVRPKGQSFDPNRWNECAPGIHFYLNFKEAVNH